MTTPSVLGPATHPGYIRPDHSLLVARGLLHRLEFHHLKCVISRHSLHQVGRRNDEINIRSYSSHVVLTAEPPHHISPLTVLATAYFDALLCQDTAILLPQLVSCHFSLATTVLELCRKATPLHSDNDKMLASVPSQFN